jgi:Ca-activated chloride channel family protein
MRLAEPGWLVLLLLVPLPWVLGRARGRVAWPTLTGFGPRGRWVARLKAGLPYALRGATVGCVAVALARPQVVLGTTHVAGQGVAIVLALDQSSTMEAADFPAGPGLPPLTRLEAARRTLTKFIEGRPDDLIGLVVFANYQDLAAPLTLDHDFLIDSVRSVRPARPGDDGTNIGDAIVWALGALKDAKPRRKVLILLTDGRNDPAVAEPTDPEEAARLARTLGVTVHTVAVGRAGTMLRGVEPLTGLPVSTEVDGPDLALLERLAELGGGRAFVATDPHALDGVFAAIDSLERSPVQGWVRTRYRETYGRWAASALGLIVAERLLAAWWLRRLP